MKSKISTEEWKKVLKLYLYGKLKITKIANMFNIDGNNIIAMAHRKGIYTSRVKHYTLNKNIFKKINNQKKAYWLGFIAADGSLFHNKLMITLAIKDKQHIYKFKRFLKSNHLIKNIVNNGYPSAMFSISNKDLIKSILKLGIPYRKSYNLKDFPKIHKKYYRHFIRGMFDGDGCFNITKVGNHRKLRLLFIGTIKMVKLIQKELIKHCKLNKTKLRIPKNSPTSAYLEYKGNKQLKRIYNYLYKGSTICLERKKEIADSVLFK